MFAVAFLFPKSVLALLDSGLGFILPILLLYLLVVYPLIPKARNRYFLAVAPEGLYAMVPAEDFPQFTPWKQIKDFTLSNPDEGEDKDHTSGRLQFHRREANERRFTLYTESGVYAFPLKAIEQDYLFLMKMNEKKNSVQTDRE